MAEVFFDNPPTLSGEEREQLQQLYRYLNAMSEKLNTALMSISIEQMEPEVAQTIRTAGGEAVEKNYTSLKTMIIKTAEIVRHEMDEITTTLRDEYVALSEQFGTYESSLQNTITATAQGVVENFHYEERISGLEEDAEGLTNKLDSYIFMGIIGHDAQDNPITGIAIGDGVTSYDQQGNAQINDNRKMATFTANRLTFYQNGIETAWFGDSKFYIAQGELTQGLKIGNHTWKPLTGGAIALVAG